MVIYEYDLSKCHNSESFSWNILKSTKDEKVKFIRLVWFNEFPRQNEFEFCTHLQCKDMKRSIGYRIVSRKVFWGVLRLYLQYLWLFAVKISVLLVKRFWIQYSLSRSWLFWKSKTKWKHNSTMNFYVMSFKTFHSAKCIAISITDSGTSESHLKLSA